MSDIALITSTGLRLRDQLRNSEVIEVVTEFGTVPVVRGQWGDGQGVVSLIRSGGDRPVPPHKVNHRANMQALGQLGVSHVLATSVVGALVPALGSGSLLVPDQFLDFTKAQPGTIFGEDRFQFMDFTQPYCPTVRGALLQAARDQEVPVGNAGCYVGVDGPRYETAAEVRMFRMLGGDVIGMSNVPEAIYARELGLCYAAVCVVSNPAAGLSNESVLIEGINAQVSETNPTVLRLLYAAQERLRTQPPCGCIPETRVIQAAP